MLTFLQFLSERRSNPELNNDRRLLVDKIYSYKNHPDVKNIGISFTSIPKFGINPQSDFGTPLGIYAYPINYIISHLNSDVKRFSVPFAGNRPYYFIFKVNTPSKMLDIQNATKNDLDAAIAETQRFSKDFDVDEALKKTKQYYFNGFRTESYGALIFGLTRYFAMYRNNKFKSFNFDQSFTRTWGFTLDKNFGYVGAIDRGDGVIHNNEGTQMFILKKEYGTLLDLGNNDRSNKDREMPRSDYNLVKHTEAKTFHTNLLNDLSSLELIDRHNKNLNLPLNHPLKVWISVKKDYEWYSLLDLLTNKFFIDLFAKIRGNYDLIYNNPKIRYLLSLAFFFPKAISQRDKPKLISYYREKTNDKILETLLSVSSGTNMLPISFNDMINSWKLYLTQKELDNAKINFKYSPNSVSEKGVKNIKSHQVGKLTSVKSAQNMYDDIYASLDVF